MAKKLFIILALMAAVTGTAFSQFSPHKYNSGDVLLGVNLGINMTPTAYKLAEFPWEKANYAATADFGLNLDIYFFPWLSISPGVSAKTGVYVFLDNDIAGDPQIDLAGIAKTPVCVTSSLLAHINVPLLNFLYIGGGVSINIPLTSWSVTDMKIKDSEVSFGAKGEVFYGFPIEAGFDFVKKNKGGGRFLLRVTPEYHSEGFFMPVGIMWQLYNGRLFANKDK